MTEAHQIRAGDSALVEQDKDGKQHTRRGFYVGTISGKRFYFDDVQPGDFALEDIAHSLALKCRFNSHTSKFYSVAEHCYWVSLNCDDPLGGLLHEVDETYTPDMASPLKWWLNKNYDECWRKLEDRIQEAGFRAFKLQWPMHESIKLADRRMLVTEMRDLMPNRDDYLWDGAPLPYDFHVQCWGPELAEQRFLERYYDLRKAAAH